ncbi:MAG: DUF3037 domain-containing protein, partial [Muribaculaceae bacterium]|nr:DUF3037 domain-containing protein [Muribaculaceae bacterium]
MNTDQNFLYEYAVIRFMPDIARQEFVNIGLIMMCKRKKWMKFAYNIDNQRINTLNCVGLTPEMVEHQILSFVELS